MWVCCFKYKYTMYLKICTSKQVYMCIADEKTETYVNIWIPGIKVKTEHCTDICDTDVILSPGVETDCNSWNIPFTTYMHCITNDYKNTNENQMFLYFI